MAKLINLVTKKIPSSTDYEAKLAKDPGEAELIRAGKEAHDSLLRKYRGDG